MPKKQTNPRVLRPIVWQGSKAPLLSSLLPLIAARPHELFVEVFAGGLSVTLAKPRSKVEVINDLHGELVNFYRCAQTHAPELRRIMRWQINSRALFDAARQATGGTDIQRAARFWFLNAVSFGGCNDGFGVAKKSGGGGALANWPFRLSTLKSASRRLHRVSVENLDWQRCFKIYDIPEALFFLDPPYVGGAQCAYDAWSIETMQHFAEAVRALRGDWIVTVGDSPAMRKMWAFARILPVERARGITRAVKGARFAELIITKKHS